MNVEKILMLKLRNFCRIQKLFLKKGKKKIPANAELKMQKFTNMALARKWAVRQATQSETPLRSPTYFV